LNENENGRLREKKKRLRELDGADYQKKARDLSNPVRDVIDTTSDNYFARLWRHLYRCRLRLFVNHYNNE